MLRVVRARILGLAALTGCSFSASFADGVDAPPKDATPDEAPRPERVAGALGLWRFDDGSGSAMVRDYAPDPAGPLGPMHLTIETPAAVTWVTGGLRIDSRVTIASDPNPHGAKSIANSGAFTLEIWVTPADITQGTDPPDGIGVDFATILQASGSINSHNLMVTQVGDSFAARVRTAATMNGDNPQNATPDIQAIGGSVTPGAITQLVLVGSATERVLYVNGTPFMSNPGSQGALLWDDTYKIRIGDTINYDRHWKGTLWFMALYDRALSPADILTNRGAGFDCTGC